MSESTLEADIKAALIKERNRLKDCNTAEEENRWELCVEFIKRINQGGAELDIRRPWQHPIKL